MAVNPFLIFGIPQKFCVDRDFIDKRFYTLSRENHPDRFATQATDIKQAALKKMSEINEAYQTLIDEDARREALLEINGHKKEENSKKPTLPVELAEEWFELQDKVMESDGSQALTLLQNFESQLVERNMKLKQTVLDLEKQWDSSTEGNSQNEIAQKISKKITDQSYLKSLLKDVERLKLRFKL